jgi:hypothetical protein
LAESERTEKEYEPGRECDASTTDCGDQVRRCVHVESAAASLEKPTLNKGLRGGGTKEVR